MPKPGTWREGRSPLTWLLKIHSPSQAWGETKRLPRPNFLPYLFPVPTLPLLPLFPPWAQAPGVLTGLDSQSWEGTSSQSISIYWGDRARGNKEEGVKGSQTEGRVEGGVGMDGASHLASGVSHHLQNLGREMW